MKNVERIHSTFFNQKHILKNRYVFLDIQLLTFPSSIIEKGVSSLPSKLCLKVFFVSCSIALQKFNVYTCDGLKQRK